MGFSYYPRHHLKLGERATHTGINSVDLAISERERGEFCCLVRVVLNWWIDCIWLLVLKCNVES
jgi:hypothetical protein